MLQELKQGTFAYDVASRRYIAFLEITHFLFQEKRLPGSTGHEASCLETEAQCLESAVHSDLVIVYKHCSNLLEPETIRLTSCAAPQFPQTLTRGEQEEH